jgi:putative transposase
VSRPLRFSYAGALHHTTLRCNNREFLFDEASFALFHDVLQAARGRFPLLLYNYCLMTNHVHLLFEVGADDTLSKAMHWVGNTFSRRFNRARSRNGHLWEGRFRSTIVEAASYFLRCMMYVDLNPVWAGMAGRPEDYRWSGHAALRAEDRAELDFHPLYLEGGSDAASRYVSYRALLDNEAKRPALSLATEHFVGRAPFVARMAQRFGVAGEGAFVRRWPLGPDLFALGPRMGRAVEPR